jgi:hypothetical protein
VSYGGKSPAGFWLSLNSCRKESLFVAHVAADRAEMGAVLPVKTDGDSRFGFDGSAV